MYNPDYGHNQIKNLDIEHNQYKYQPKVQYDSSINFQLITML